MKKNKFNFKYKMFIIIRYATKHSTGKIEVSAAFFLEKYNKFKRLLKGVRLNEIMLKAENEFTLRYFDGLEQAKIWLTALHTKEEKE